MSRLLYAFLVGLASSLIGFLTCLTLGLMHPNGEAWVGWAVAWLVAGLPATLLGAALSALAVQRFLRLQSHFSRALAFIVNSVAVALFGYLPLLQAVLLGA